MSLDTTAATLLRGAWSALQGGQAHQARQQCERALKLAPQSFDGWRILALAREALGDAVGVREALDRAHALRPDDPGTAFELGSWLLQHDDAAAARPLLRAAMNAMPNEPRAAFRYGTASFLDNDFAAAAEGFAAVTRSDPQWAEAWNNLSAALGRLQDYPAAIAAARRLVRLRPQAAASHQALAALLSNRFDAESLREGMQAAERALQLEPDLAEAHRNAAVLLRKLGDPVRAELHARRAHQLAPHDPDAVDTLGEQLLINGRAADAEALYAAALDAGITHPALVRQHGIALLHNDRAAAACEALAASVRMQPDDQRAIAHLGLALAGSGQLEAAVDLIGLHRHVRAIALPTPAGFADNAAFRAALADDVRHHSQQRWEPAGLAARAAYLSGNLMADRTPAIAGFEQCLRAAIEGFLAACRAQPVATRAGDVFLANVPDGYRLHVWATRAAQSGYIDTHIHEDSWLSGAYYVELPPAISDDDPSFSGWIEFGRPYANFHDWPEGATRRVRPQAGTLLLFPSYLFHRTLPYTGGGERISISFDLAAV